MRTYRLLVPVTGFLAGLTLASSDAPSAEVDYPHDTVTLLTHSSPGGGTDVFLREMVKHLGPIMGVDFVVENVPAGSGAQAMARLATAPADGSIFYGTTPTFINTSIISDPQYTWEDLEPLVNVFLDPQIIYTRAESPFDTLRDAIDAAEESQDRQSWGVSSPGSLDRQLMERLNRTLTEIDPIIVTHEGGGDTLISVLNGTVALAAGEVQELRSQIEAEDIKLIGTYTEERLDQFPDVPTAREQGVDIVASKFRGLAGPQGLPEDVVAAWEEAIPLVLEDPDFQKFYQQSSLVPTFMPHEEYVGFIREFAKEQRQYFREAGIIEG